MVNPLKPLLIITASTYISAASSKLELDCKVINVSQKTFDNHFSEDIIDAKESVINFKL